VAVARSTISVLGKLEPAAVQGAAKAEADGAGGTKTGLMAQLFGKK
jgi:hypothetical protein